ncbi:MAG: gliding motility-associated C-terminal domain-containing protein [Bacteroidia bacterium]|nr:gliding motility-associated C-terminal domain-containing protein [Bacteroidia bacterium]
MENIIYSLNQKFNQRKISNYYRLSLISFLLITAGLLINIKTQAQIAPTLIPVGGFQIDGGLQSNTPISGVGDWTLGTGGSFVLNSNGTPVDPTRTQLVYDDFNTSSDMTFQGGKFNDDPNTWTWSYSSASSKNDINNALYHLAADASNNTWLIVAGDRLSTNGTSYIDFEFLQNTLTRTANFGFNSAGTNSGRTVNDIVLSMEYSNGGSNATVHMYFWKPVGTGYKYVEQVIPANVAFAITNINSEPVPFGAFGNNSYSPFQFVEAAINLTAFFGYVEPCLGISVKSIMVKTKASDSETAALGDFVGPIPVRLDLGTATISYDSPLCGAGMSFVNQIGVSGGTYSSSPVGLSINSLTGEINLGSSNPGTYTVTYSFVTNNCPKSVTTNITINPIPSSPVSASVDRNIVCAEDNGNIILSANGGSGSTLNWYTGGCNGTLIGSGNNFSIPSPVQTTTYYASWENSCGNSGCVQVTVTVSPQLTVSATGSVQVSCYNGNDGVITVSVIGGTGSYTYSINGGPVQSSNVFTGLLAGSYIINAYDTYGCSAATKSITILNPPLLTVSAIGSSQVSCHNASDGSLTITAAGGTGAYSYSLNGGLSQTSNIFSGLTAGTYSYIVTDANGCAASSATPLVISNPALLTVTATGSSQVSCNNSSDASITITATGGTGTYSYSLNGGTSQASNIFSGLTAGSYSYIVTDANGCVASSVSSIIISNPGLLTASAISSSHVSCNNASDGSITITASGGTGAYSYSLNGGVFQASNIFSGLSAGSYSYVVTDANGCIFTLVNSIIIENPVLLTATAIGSSQVSCNNSADGYITVIASGGTGIYSYSLNGGLAQTSNVFNGLTSGTYIITVMDQFKCSAVTSAITISNPELLKVFATGSSQVSCNNVSDGSITASATGGTGAYSYSINGGIVQSSNIFSGLSAGSYSVVVFDANGCSALAGVPIVITNPPLLSASAIGSSQVSCNNASDGILTITANGGTGAYSYSINGGQAQISNVFSGLSSGTYNYKVYDANGCSVSSAVPVIISNPPLLSATAVGSSQVSCFNASDGTITVSAFGGTGSYSYTLNGGSAQSSNIFSGLSAGSYSVMVYDVNGCPSLACAPIVILNPAQLTVSATGSSQVSCYNSSDGSITASAVGGTGAYSYSLNGGNAQTSNSYSGLSSGTYNIVVSDINGCSATVESPIIILNPALLSVSAVGSYQVSCHNYNDGLLTVSANGGTGLYSYSINGGNVQGSNVFTALPAGSYNFIVVDINGCSASGSAPVVIANPDLLTASAVGSAQVSCYNYSDAEITVSADGGTGVYSYTLNNGTPQSSNSFSGLPNGSYSIIVSDVNGCSVSLNNAVFIDNPKPVTVSAVGSAQVSCFDSNDGVITVSANGGTGSYTYWLNNGTSQSSNVFSGLLSGLYVISVTDQNGCMAGVDGIAIVNPTLLTANAEGSSQVSCYNSSDGVINVNVTGGTGSYSYSLNGGTPQSSNVFSGLSSGSFLINVTDENGCLTGTHVININNPPQLSLSTEGSSQVSCYNSSDGLVIAIATGGTGAYSYSLNGGVAQSSNEFYGLSGGSYVVNVTDQNGCLAIAPSIQIANPNALTLTAHGSPQVTCYNSSDGVISVNASGGTGAYSYSLNGGSSQSSNIFSGLFSGSYVINVTDQNGCLAGTSSIQIANPALISASAYGSSQVTCNNSNDGYITVIAMGGTGAYSYSLNGGNSQTSNAFTGLLSGNYVINVTDANGCQAGSSYYQIANPPLLSANAFITANISCYNLANGVITVNANGGTGYYSYSLDGGPVQTSNVFSNQGPGSHIISVYDQNICIANTQAISLSNPELLTATSVISDQVSCYNSSDGQITVSAIGGSGSYYYSLNGGPLQTSNVFSGLASSSYVVNVYDQNNCFASALPLSIANPALLHASAVVTEQVSCYNVLDGAIIVNANGGTGSYTYSLNGTLAQSSNLFYGLASGNYEVVVYDQHNCIASSNPVTIINPEPIAVNANQTNIGCFGSSDGTVVVNVAGGAFPYSYSLDGQNFQNSNIFESLSAGPFSVIVNDAKGCNSKPFELNIVQLAPVEFSYNVISGNKCNGINDAVVEVQVASGTPPYTYELNNGTAVSNSTLTGVPAGSNTISVYDSEGCLSSTLFSIEEQSAIKTELLSATDANCIGRKDGSINVEVTGGTGSYSYLWSNGSIQSQLYGLDAGEYSLTVTDENGCKSLFSQAIVPGDVSEEIVIRNAFSPNSDGINDRWEIDNILLYPDNQLTIINRWGNEVLTVKDYQNEWDGSQLAEGTYYYLLKVNMCDEYRTFNGYVTILR